MDLFKNSIGIGQREHTHDKNREQKWHLSPLLDKDLYDQFPQNIKIEEEDEVKKEVSQMSNMEFCYCIDETGVPVILTDFIDISNVTLSKRQKEFK